MRRGGKTVPQAPHHGPIFQRHAMPWCAHVPLSNAMLRGAVLTKGQRAQHVAQRDADDEAQVEGHDHQHQHQVQEDGGSREQRTLRVARQLWGAGQGRGGGQGSEAGRKRHVESGERLSQENPRGRRRGQGSRAAAGTCIPSLRSLPPAPSLTSSRVTNCSGCWRGAYAPSMPLLSDDRALALLIPRSMGMVLMALLRRGSWPFCDSMLLRLSAWP